MFSIQHNVTVNLNQGVEPKLMTEVRGSQNVYDRTHFWNFFRFCDPPHTNHSWT